jgi:hypothetical protein
MLRSGGRRVLSRYFRTVCSRFRSTICLQTKSFLESPQNTDRRCLRQYHASTRLDTVIVHFRAVIGGVSATHSSPFQHNSEHVTISTTPNKALQKMSSDRSRIALSTSVPPVSHHQRLSTAFTRAILRNGRIAVARRGTEWVARRRLSAG